MVHQLVNVPHTPYNDKALTPLTLEQALEILFDVVPHMPIESRTSFLAMFRGNTSRFSSRKAFRISTPPLRLPLTSDALRSVVQAKTVQHLCESDSAFEAKQRATEKACRRFGGSEGVIKRYEKPQRNQVEEKRALRMVFSPTNTYTIPYGDPWSIGGATLPGNRRTFETAAGSTTRFDHWGSKDLSPRVGGCSPA